MVRPARAVVPLGAPNHSFAERMAQHAGCTRESGTLCIPGASRGRAGRPFVRGVDEASLAVPQGSSLSFPARRSGRSEGPRRQRATRAARFRNGRRS